MTADMPVGDLYLKGEHVGAMHTWEASFEAPTPLERAVADGRRLVDVSALADDPIYSDDPLRLTTIIASGDLARFAMDSETAIALVLLGRVYDAWHVMEPWETGASIDGSESVTWSYCLYCEEKIELWIRHGEVYLPDVPACRHPHLACDVNGEPVHLALEEGDREDH